MTPQSSLLVIMYYAATASIGLFVVSILEVDLIFLRDKANQYNTMCPKFSKQYERTTTTGISFAKFNNSQEAGSSVFLGQLPSTHLCWFGQPTT